MGNILNGCKSGKVTIYTQTYNALPFVEQCINSVLSQTYLNFEYIVVDNGCTDGSREILERYAARDKRIKLIQLPENRREIITAMVRQYGTGEYYTVLDSDDWWEPTYLEQLVGIAEETHSDIVCTGTFMHMDNFSSIAERRMECCVTLDRKDYAVAFPYYHVFFRANWAKLFKMSLFANQDFEPIDRMDILYGKDTLRCFAMLANSHRIYLDNTILHHYRIHKRSASFKYSPKRFVSDVYLYNDAIDFLSAFGPVSAQNRNFLQCVYSNAVIDTTGVIQNSTLSPAGKLREYRTIAAHPLTQAAYRECTDESANRSKMNLLVRTLEAGAALGKEDDTDLRAVMQILLPRCGRAVIAANAGLFLEDAQLLQSLLRDEPEPVLENLLERLEKNQGVKRYALPKAIQALAVDNPLLCGISDAVFLRKYGRLYMMVWREEYLPALEEMTGLLLENQVDGGRETFLTLFISLAAVTEQVPAFIFGKLQLAQLFLRQNRLTECHAVVAELEEMGLVDNEELDELCRRLEEAGS